MPNMKTLALSCALLGALATGVVYAEAPGIAPEAATGYAEKAGWSAQKFMVAAANPLAADAGYRMLKQGGTAIDAAIATQMVLGLVEPQSSGLGGGAFMLYSDAKQVQSYDGRETAPAAATEHLFQTPEGKALPFFEAVVGGRSVGTPGVLRMLELAHREHGKLPWATLFGPAIKLADAGFKVSPRLHALLSSDKYLLLDPVAAAYFYDQDKQAWPVGHVLKNPALARSLREIARGGAAAFYQGRIGADIVAKVTQHPTNPGSLSLADLRAYQAKKLPPICSDYRRWTVCGAPPPSSGGIAIAQMLGILEHTTIDQDAPQDGVLNVEAIHLFSEAGRLAFADRNRYVADTDFVPLPGNGVAALLDPAYLAQRASLIGPLSMGRAMPGTPPGMSVAWGLDHALELPSTSHLAVVDRYGAALSMTTTVENEFGARQMVDGFLLNNQLTDFSFNSSDADGPIANRVQAGKRPRSAMSPTLVFEKGSKKLFLATGSPGGSAIINYVAKVLVGTMDWNLNLQQAISLPNFGSRNGPTELELGRVQPGLVEALTARGHTVKVIEQNSGLQGIMRVSKNGHDSWFGAADPRREGVARGD